MTNERYGAFPHDWNLFDLGLGLTNDLLPVVSNPNAQVSEKSKMKGVGKTPSLYNRDREVVGISQWTLHVATEGDVQRWAREPDYGICIQTRHLRALDIDVEDPATAKLIITEVESALGMNLPCRYRQNSGKCLLAFQMPGDFAKRVLRTAHGAIEFLANGQQFVACGTHPSGARYEWEGLTVEGFPAVEPEQFEKLWALLSRIFGTEGSISQGNTTRKRGADLELDDPVATQLDVLGEGRDGQLYIECPWAFAHTSDTGIGQTVYFPKGTNGYQHGHFHCLHASCARRTDQEFRDALKCNAFDVDQEFSVVGGKGGAGGKEASGEELETDFDELAVPSEGDESAAQPQPSLIRDKTGRPEAAVINITAMLERPDMVGVNLRHDEFRDEIMLSTLRDPKGWRRFTDTDYTKLRRLFDKLGFKPVGREMVRDCVGLVAKENTFDSAIEWIEGLKWDGVPRVEGFMVNYLGAPDDDYSRAVSRYMWTALAGRCLVPGIKADMAPILVGSQDIGKSIAIQAISPSQECFVSINLNAKEEDLARNMRGCLVGELAELKGLASRDLESIKDFMTRTHEKWVPKFQEFSNTYPRRLLFIGTSNRDDFLADETGNRRWLPIRVTKGDVKSIDCDREQLWAEAREMFIKTGVAYQEAALLAQPVHEEFKAHDVWEDAISGWLRAPSNNDESKLNGDEPLQIKDIATEVLFLQLHAITKAVQMRLAKTLTTLGYKKAVKTISGRATKVWIRKD